MARREDDVVERLRREGSEPRALPAPRETPRQIFAALASEAERALGPRARSVEPQLAKVRRLLDEPAGADPRALAEALDKLEYLFDALVSGTG